MVQGSIVIVQYSGFKGAYPDFAFIQSLLCNTCLDVLPLVYEAEPLYKGFLGRAWEPGSKVFPALFNLPALDASEIIKEGQKNEILSGFFSS